MASVSLLFILYCHYALVWYHGYSCWRSC